MVINNWKGLNNNAGILPRDYTYTVKPGISKLFEKQKKVYYCPMFTIEEVIYVINGFKSSHKKFIIAQGCLLMTGLLLPGSSVFISRGLLRI